MNILSILSSIKNFLFDPKNTRMILFAGAIVLVALLLQTCNKNAQLKQAVEVQKLETQRIQNNWDASRDSIKQFKDKNGTQVAIISGYEITKKELETKYSNLFASYEKAKADFKNTPPKTIIQIQYKEVEKIKDFSLTNKQNGVFGELKFSHDTTFAPGDFRSIKGDLHYNLAYFNKADSINVKFTDVPYYAKLNFLSPTLDMEQHMNLSTGLLKDPKTGKIKIWATTDYPGVTFSELKGAEITDDDFKKIAPLPKRWGIGVSVGPGVLYHNGAVTPGIYFGLGVNYSIIRF